MKLFKIGDCDYVAAENEKDAMREWDSVTGDNAWPEDCEEVPDAALDRLKFIDDDRPGSKHRSFREELKLAVERGEAFPYFFATSEY